MAGTGRTPRKKGVRGRKVRIPSRKSSRAALIRGESTKVDSKLRQTLHQLVDELQPADAAIAQRILHALVAAATAEAVLAADEHSDRYDCEPLTHKEQFDSAEGWKAYLRGEGRTLDEVRRDLARK